MLSRGFSLTTPPARAWGCSGGHVQDHGGDRRGEAELKEVLRVKKLMEAGGSSWDAPILEKCTTRLLKTLRPD